MSLSEKGLAIFVSLSACGYLWAVWQVAVHAFRGILRCERVMGILDGMERQRKIHGGK